MRIKEVILWSHTARKYCEELRGYADSLPFERVEIGEFTWPGYRPFQVRQPRTYSERSRADDLFSRFLAERGVVGLLTPGQTLDLFREIHWCAHRIRRIARKSFGHAEQWRLAVQTVRQLVSQIESAEEELYIANRRLIVNCVKHYAWVGEIWLGDFLQEGSKALSNAVRKFDFTRGTPFFAYAQRAIQNRLQNHLRDHLRSGSICVHPSSQTVAVRDAIAAWKKTHRHEPSDEELARLTSQPKDVVAKIRRAMLSPKNLPTAIVSLDAEVTETEDARLHELIEDRHAENVCRVAQRAEMWSAVDRLPERDRFVLRSRYLEGRTLEETGRLLHLTRARIKQIQDHAIENVREIMEPEAVVA